MMGIPTDRGIVVVRKNADGSKRVEIYADAPAKSTPFAVHSNVDTIHIDRAAAFVPFDGGQISQGPVEVTWSTADNSLYVARLATNAI